MLEVLFASLVLLLTGLALAQALSAGHAQLYANLHQVRAQALLEGLAEEIMALPYDDPDTASTPGPEAGEPDRASFDNKDDFHGFQEPVGTLVEADGTPYPSSYQVFARSVEATYGAHDPGTGGGPVPGLILLIRTIDTDGAVWTLSRFIEEP